MVVHTLQVSFDEDREQFWRNAEVLMAELEELRNETDSIMCPCNMADCPFLHENNSRTSLSGSPPLVVTSPPDSLPDEAMMNFYMRLMNGMPRRNSPPITRHADTCTAYHHHMHTVAANNSGTTSTNRKVCGRSFSLQENSPLTTNTLPAVRTPPGSYYRRKSEERHSKKPHLSRYRLSLPEKLPTMWKRSSIIEESDEDETESAEWSAHFRRASPVRMGQRKMARCRSASPSSPPLLSLPVAVSLGEANYYNEITKIKKAHLSNIN